MSRLDPHRSGKVTRASHVSRCPRTCVPRPCDAQPLGAMTHNTGKAILRALSYGNQSRDGLGTANTANFFPLQTGCPSTGLTGSTRVVKTSTRFTLGTSSSSSPALGEGHEQVHKLQRVSLLIPARPGAARTSPGEPRPPAHKQHPVGHHGDNRKGHRRRRAFADGPKHQAGGNPRDHTFRRGERGVARLGTLRSVVSGTGRGVGGQRCGGDVATGGE